MMSTPAGTGISVKWYEATWRSSEWYRSPWATTNCEDLINTYDTCARRLWSTIAEQPACVVYAYKVFVTGY